MSRIGSKLIKIIFGEVGLFLLVIIGISLVKVIPSQKAVEDSFQSPVYFKKIFEKENFVTTFIGKEDNLKRIDVLFKNPNLESRDEVEIILLKDKREIFRKTYNGYNFGDTSHARIDFPLIADSKGKTFELAVREIKKIDGKLELGIKDENINFIQYYGQKISFSMAFKNSSEILLNIFKNQLIVLGLPAVLWGIFLW